MDTKQETIELYKLHSNLANEVTRHRNTANSFYISLTSAILIFYVAQIDGVSSAPTVFTIAGGVLGMCISVLWFASVRYYRRLNQAKFACLDKLEKTLSFQFFSEEWSILKKKRFKWLELTRIEIWLPVLYLIVFAVLLLYAL